MRHPLWLVAAATMLALAGCNEAESKQSEPEKAEQVRIPVRAQAPERDSISAYFETNARIIAENRVEVMAKGSGLVTALNFEEGDRVDEGAVLAELERDELQAQVQQAQVNVRQNRYQMEKAVEQYEKGILSEVEAENARFAYEAAVASLDVQKLALENQTLRAPISGVIAARNINEGQMISAGTPAFTIVDPQSYILPITPPENQLPNLALGQLAKVRIDSVDDQEFDARIRRVNPTVDATTGTVKVVLDFAPEARPHLREGSFARVRLVMETREDVLVVPKDAVIEENARKYLMLVEEELDATPSDTGPETGYEEDSGEAARRLVAKRVEINTGLEDANQIEVMEGLSDEDLVVTLGQHTLKPGSPVTVQTAEEAMEARSGLSADKALGRAIGRSMTEY